ncbi:MAG: protoglobin family protein [Deltaproteobacteria bacterium]|nr:protoglobin family protein [Deltaproteobacteria bacterium]
MSAFEPQAVDVARLEGDVAYRVAFLTAYVGLTEVDRALIRASRPHLTPWLDALMVAIEGRLLGFSNTARHFDGLPPAMVTVHLRAYVDTILRPRDEAQLAAYLDHVARAHGPDGGDPRIVVPLVEVSGLLAFITDQVIGAVAELDLPVERRFAAARAWSKLLWIQADLFHWDAARRARA